MKNILNTLVLFGISFAFNSAKAGEAVTAITVESPRGDVISPPQIPADQPGRYVFRFEGNNPMAAFEQLKRQLPNAKFEKIDINIGVRTVDLDVTGLSDAEALAKLKKIITLRSQCPLGAKSTDDVKQCEERALSSANAYNYGNWLERARKVKKVTISGNALTTRINDVKERDVVEIQKAIDQVQFDTQDSNAVDSKFFTVRTERRKTS